MRKIIFFCLPFSVVVVVGLLGVRSTQRQAARQQMRACIIYTYCVGAYDCRTRTGSPCIALDKWEYGYDDESWIQVFLVRFVCIVFVFLCCICECVSFEFFFYRMRIGCVRLERFKMMVQIGVELAMSRRQLI